MTLKAYTLALALAAPTATLAGTVIIDEPTTPEAPAPVVVETVVETLTTTPEAAAAVTEAVETLQTAEPGSPEAVAAVATVASNVAIPPNLTPVQVQQAVNILATLIAATPAGSPGRQALQQQLAQLQ